ncbi:hypothetical protein C8Q76DRAFT_35871 [Earliella scabrosa]|nr:hypothetical protein C8Q76DRAFT_35871 [Earliella scabrosa]
MAVLIPMLSQLCVTDQSWAQAPFLLPTDAHKGLSVEVPFNTGTTFPTCQIRLCSCHSSGGPTRHLLTIAVASVIAAYKDTAILAAKYTKKVCVEQTFLL